MCEKCNIEHYDHHAGVKRIEPQLIFPDFLYV